MISSNKNTSEGTQQIIKFNNLDAEGEELFQQNNNQHNQNEINREKENIMLNDKSGINMDVTRKMATFMDFSVILNKKNLNDETALELGLNKTGLGKMQNDLWDISVIGKN